MEIPGRWKKERIPLITPFFSRSVCHARVLSRKFIHMGRIKINTIKLPALFPRPLKIIARGYARKRHSRVLIRDKPRDSTRAFI